MIYSLPAAIILFGIILVIPTLDEPRYADPNWREEFGYVDVSLDRSGELSQKFYAARDRNLTPAAQRWDRGTVVISLGLSIAGLLLALRVRKCRDLRDLKTLSTARAMRDSAYAAWWGWVPAQCAWYYYTHSRGDYPWWADNIAIPIGGTLFFCLLGFPLVLTCARLASGGVSLPVRMIQLPKSIRGLVATGLSTVPLAWFVFAGHRAFLEGDVFTIPVSVGGVYATISLWAAACAPRVV